MRINEETLNVRDERTCRQSAAEATEWLQSGMSGVNLLPRARRGQLPLALAERVLDRNGARQRRPAPLRGPQEKRLLSVMNVQGLMGLTACDGGRPWFACSELFVGQSRAKSATSDMPPSKP